MPQPFAIISFRADGPIKTWSDLRGAHVHNSRTKPIAHAVLGAPPPEHLIGSGDLVADVKSKMRAVDIDPAKLRKNGVIAYEAVLTASPDFFRFGSADERKSRLDAWKAQQVRFAVDRWGRHRIASMVLHLDEETPHIHLVVLPLDVKSDKRRNDRTVRWGLVGRTISGPGKYDQLQDDYSAAMAQFGLVRGVRGSGQKNEPMGRFIQRTQDEKLAAERERAAATAARRAAEAERLAAEEDRVAALRREAQLLRELDEVRSEKEKLAGLHAEVKRARAAMEAERAEFEDLRSALRASRAQIARDRETLSDERRRAEIDAQSIAAQRVEIDNALHLARAFKNAMHRVPPGAMHPAAEQAGRAASSLHRSVASIAKGPARDVAPIFAQAAAAVGQASLR